MDLDAALRDLSRALEGPDARGRNGRIAAARQAVTLHCLKALGVETRETSISAVFRALSGAAERGARRQCAVLLLHALAVRGLIPVSAAADMCALAETALRDVLLRCDYPFGGSIEQKMQVLERLHRAIGELLQPFEPTFPNWQGLYAG